MLADDARTWKMKRYLSVQASRDWTRRVVKGKAGGLGYACRPRRGTGVVNKNRALRVALGGPML